VHNLFVTGGDTAADAWRDSRAADEANAEREMRQFAWWLRVQPLKWDQVTVLADRPSRAECAARVCTGRL
jgi:hypothetical protein